MRGIPFLSLAVLCVLVVGLSQAEPEKEKEAKGDAELIDIREIDPSIIVEMRYASEQNFLKRKLYPMNRCFLRRGVAVRLAKAQAILKKDGFGLKVWDGYRPLSVQKALWKIKPDSRYVANPARGSRHNRGAAVDVTLVDAKGKEVQMPTDFDDFSGKAGAGFRLLPAVMVANRTKLQSAMKAAGFELLESEWWHFDAPGWRKYPLLDVDFSEITRKSSAKSGQGDQSKSPGQ